NPHPSTMRACTPPACAREIMIELESQLQSLATKILPNLEFFNLLGFDKLVHFFAFAILSLLMIVGFNKQYSDGCYHFNINYLTIFSLISYGALLEFIQQYIPDRNFEIWDAVANGLGVIFGRFMFFMIYKTRLI
ncbi:MAG: VanZ family protein, partial [Cytophagales bacterium]